MKRGDLSRRDFTKLSMAALAGTAAGVTLTGCNGGDDKKKDATGNGDGKKLTEAEAELYTRKTPR